MDLELLARNLKKCREMAKLTTVELSKKSKISVGLINQIENNKTNGVPKIMTILALSTAVDYNITDPDLEKAFQEPTELRKLKDKLTESLRLHSILCDIEANSFLEIAIQEQTMDSLSKYASFA